MALKVTNKINGRPRFLYRKNKLFSPPFRKLIQPSFDYAFSAWYPNLNKKLKSKLQILQNKWIQFCLYLNKRAHIGQNEFEKKINWLPANDRFEKFISSISFMSDVFKTAGQRTTTTRATLPKLNQPLRKTNQRQKSISCMAPIVWNNLPSFLKTTEFTALIRS